MKTYVKFRGKEYPAPAWAKYMAIDSDGEVWVFAKKPEIGDFNRVWFRQSMRQRRLCDTKYPRRTEQELYILEEA